jgi:hypothetical protein
MRLNLGLWLKLVVLLFPAIYSCNFQNREADLIIHNATIYALDVENSLFQAVAVKGGRILELGAERQILNRYKAPKVIDAKKQFVLPAFVGGRVIPTSGLGSDNLKSEILKLEELFFARGYSSVSLGGLTKREIDELVKWIDEGEFKIRLNLMPDVRDEENAQLYQKGIVLGESYSIRSFFCEPDKDSGMIDVSVLQQIRNAGFQFHTKSSNDSLIHQALESYIEVLVGTNDYRWSIGGIQRVYPEDVSLFSENTIIPFMEVGCYQDEIEPVLSLFKSLSTQLGIIGLSFDCVDMENLVLIHLLDEQLSRRLLIQSMTIFPAIANFEEHEKGTLEEGKYADFVFFDRDILKVSRDELTKVKVQRTVLGGVEVFIR